PRLTTMIARIWRGWTTEENADAYHRALTRTVLPEIASRNIPGYRGVHVLRRPHPDDNEVEFVTIMWFDAIDNIRAFVGSDIEQAHVPDIARAVLKRFDARAAHYDCDQSPDA
ncbi:MAG: antibiotic biosynthesis monooxygenase family protein, partial [Phycisphaerales bacterium]